MEFPSGYFFCCLELYGSLLYGVAADFLGDHVILLSEELFWVKNWLLWSSFSGFLSLPTLRTLFLDCWVWFWSTAWRAWLGLTMMTDLLEGCFWFLMVLILLSFRTWLLIIQLLCIIRLSLPTSLVNNPNKLSFFSFSFSFSFYFFGGSFSLYFFMILEALVSLLILVSLFWRLVLLVISCCWTCDFKILILSWRRSLILCYFFKYSGVYKFRETSV